MNFFFCAHGPLPVRRARWTRLDASPVHNRGTRPKSYDRGEPSGGLAGTAPRVIKVAGLRKLPGPKHVPETAVMQAAEHP